MTSSRVGAEETSALRVEILRTTYVKPHKPLGRKDCHLTSFDLIYLPTTPNQPLLIYKGCPQEFDEVEKKLKHGLSVVLEDFYPLAGRIGKDEDGILRAEYDDDMEGVEFTLAAALDIHVQDLIMEQEIRPIHDFFPCTGVSNWVGLRRSPLCVQLTKVKDGFALGCGFNHSVCDGKSIWDFIKAWAETCKLGSRTINSVKPFHDRTKVRNTRVKLDLPLKSDFKYEYDMHASYRFFRFSESAIDKIRSSINKGNAKPFSTFQCLATHVWRAVTRARQLKPEDQTALVVYGDIRSKIDPPIPDSYFGNLVQETVVPSKACLVLDGPPEACTSLIQEALRNKDSNSVNKRITNWEINPELNYFVGLGDSLVSLGGSYKFKIYETDFGWGNPERVRIGPNHFFHDGSVYLHQGMSGGGSIDMDICLVDEAMKRLEADKEFLMNDD